MSEVSVDNPLVSKEVSISNLFQENIIEFTKLFLKAGVHLGHPTSKWNPFMKAYIREESKGIHIIDLYKTRHKLIEACEFIKKIVASEKDILYVGTKQQSKSIIAQYANLVGMPYVSERWLGGMLTNLYTLRKSINKMRAIEEKLKSGLYSKKEYLALKKTTDKSKKSLGPISTMKRLPGALFIVDINKDHIALSEANKLGIPVVAMCDTNTNPTKVDYPIPSNDDSSNSIFIICKAISEAVSEGLSTRKNTSKEKEASKETKDKILPSQQQAAGSKNNLVEKNQETKKP